MHHKRNIFQRSSLTFSVRVCSSEGGDLGFGRSSLSKCILFAPCGGEHASIMEFLVGIICLGQLVDRSGRHCQSLGALNLKCCRVWPLEWSHTADYPRILSNQICQDYMCFGRALCIVEQCVENETAHLLSTCVMRRYLCMPLPFTSSIRSPLFEILEVLH
jgi:hypothetical protein